MENNRTFRALAVSICFVAVISATYAPSKYVTPRAYAFLGVGDIVFEPVLDIINQTLNGLAWTVAKTAVNSITRSTVRWINSGFNGSPAFVSDLNANLQGLGDAVADRFFTSLDTSTQLATGFNLRSPFQDQLNQKLRQEYYRQTSGLLGIPAYDLYQSSQDPKAFLNGNFSRGGFNAFFATNQNPANNPFAAWDLYNRELSQEVSAAQHAREQEYQAGKGFLSYRGVCAQASKATSAALQSGDLNAIGQATDLNRKENCPDSPIKTPGSVIESQLELSLGTGIRQLELADSINEVVGALVGQMVNQVLGASGLTGVAQPSQGGGQSYIDRAASPSQYGTVSTGLTDGVVQNLNNDERGFQNMNANWQSILAAAQNAQGRCGSLPQVSQAIDRANEEISKTNTALQSVSALRTEFQSAQRGSDANKASLIAVAVTHYQTYLSSPSTPTQQEVVDSVNESSDTTGSSGTQSLYSRMKSLQQSCGI